MNAAEGVVTLHLFYETACSHNKTAVNRSWILTSENKRAQSCFLFYKQAIS
jgi:hypothetical protein